MYENSSCPLTDAFLDVEPYYIAIGMTDSQFWDDDVWLAKVYREAHNMKVEMRNEELYMAGAYNYNAFSVVMANFAQGFSKHPKPQEKYLDKPIRITPLSEREKKIEQKKAQNVIKAKLQAWAARFNSMQAAKANDGEDNMKGSE